MEKKARKTNGVEILHRRYVGDDADRKASLQEERVNAEVAQTIYELRKEAGKDEEAKGREGSEEGQVSETGFNQAQETEGYYCSEYPYSSFRLYKDVLNQMIEDFVRRGLSE